MSISANEYISAPEIAKETGANIYEVHRWLRYHRYMESEKVFGSRVVKRSEYERFKAEHPELIKQKQAA